VRGLFREYSYAGVPSRGEQWHCTSSRNQPRRLLDQTVPGLRAEGPVHNGQRAADLALGARSRRTREVRIVPILLETSKIQRCRKSRENGFLEISTAATRCRAGAEVRAHFCAKTMRFLTSPHTKRISGPGKFRSSPKKDFCNNICHKRTRSYSGMPATRRIPAILLFILGSRKLGFFSNLETVNSGAVVSVFFIASRA
jgi:hypothetical protein